KLIGTHAGLEVEHVLPVARIPKTTSGKVQRSQLAAAYEDGEFSGALKELASLAAENPHEKAETDPLVADLLAICHEFVRDRAIGPDDNLFESGVSSLTLTEIMLAFDQKYPGKVDITDLFDYPTVRQIAAFIQR
ncbi:MAG: non-ribosomal peptide synthetase, partial [Woeseiaceae bacterium]|nr:non-ribosomal peptide synthetase [Woeseiaceae bacterium]